MDREEGSLRYGKVKRRFDDLPPLLGQVVTAAFCEPDHATPTNR
jgi:hypothetical protein